MTNNPSKKEALASIAGLNGTPQQLPQNFVGSTGEGECTIEMPTAISAELSLNQILLFARQKQVSDVHLSANNPIVLRKFGKLIPQTQKGLSQEEIKKIIESDLSGELIAQFLTTGDLEFVHAISGAGRFRVTLMKQRNGWDLTARVIPTTIRSFEDSGMPESCRGLTQWAQGLVLITGPSGCGKTSSLTTLIDLINSDRSDHIITIEDPIEFAFTPKKCQITQREVNTHTLSQLNALRGALREDPDIILVSELRDLESIELAVSAAETGHLVFGTMNTNDAAQTISSLIESFPPAQQPVIRNMISESLRGVISQQLVPKEDESGLVPAYEVLIMNTAIANLIRENNMQQLNNAMSTGKSDGMVLLDNSLRDLVQKRIISAEEAYKRAINPKSLKDYLSNPQRE